LNDGRAFTASVILHGLAILALVITVRPRPLRVEVVPDVVVTLVQDQKLAIEAQAPTLGSSLSPQQELDALPPPEPKADAAMPTVSEPQRPEPLQELPYPAPAPAQPVTKPVPTPAPQPLASPAPAQKSPPVPAPKPAPQPVPVPKSVPVPQPMPVPAPALKPAPAPRPVELPTPVPAPQPVPKPTQQPTLQPRLVPVEPPLSTRAPVPKSASAVPSLPVATQAKPAQPAAVVAAAPAPPSARPRPGQALDLTAIANVLQNARSTPGRPSFNASEIDASIAKSMPTGAARLNAVQLAALQDAIRSQITPCWNLPTRPESVGPVVVLLRIQLKNDGRLLVDPSVLSVTGVNSGNSSYSRSVANSARRAVILCSPLNLPSEYYDSWRDVELNFDPSQLF
jgi:hypothetical protein